MVTLRLQVNKFVRFIFGQIYGLIKLQTILIRLILELWRSRVIIIQEYFLTIQLVQNISIPTSTLAVGLPIKCILLNLTAHQALSLRVNLVVYLRMLMLQDLTLDL